MADEQTQVVTVAILGQKIDTLITAFRDAHNEDLVWKREIESRLSAVELDNARIHESQKNTTILNTIYSSIVALAAGIAGTQK